MKQVVVCKKSELLPGEVMEASFGRLSIVVCCASDGSFYAFANRCIHQGAQMSKGKLCGAPAPTDKPGEYDYIRDGEILRCPWHGREFDIKNDGCMLSDPKQKLLSFNVMVEGDDVVVYK